MINFKKKLKDGPKNAIPFAHPPLLEGYVREAVEIETTTEKAVLVTFTDGNQCWVPKSCCKVHLYTGHNHPGDIDHGNVIDIAIWFYDKNISNT